MSYQQQSFLPLATAQNVPSHSSGKSMFQAFLPSPQLEREGRWEMEMAAYTFEPRITSDILCALDLLKAQPTALVGFLALWKHIVTHTHTHKKPTASIIC